MNLPSPSLSASLSRHPSGHSAVREASWKSRAQRILGYGAQSPEVLNVFRFSRLFSRLFFSTFFPTFSRLFVKGCWPQTSYCFGLSGLQALSSLRFCSDSIGWVLFTPRENQFITFLGWLTPTPAQLESRNEPSYCFRLLHVDFGHFHILHI